MDGFKITEGERSENKSKDQAETEEKIRRKLRGSYAETWLGSMLVIQISGLIRTNFGISFFFGLSLKTDTPQFKEMFKHVLNFKCK